jgi:integrase
VLRRSPRRYSVRLHDLRHLAISLHINSGDDISVVSKLAGHTSISVTADIYGHLLKRVQQEAAEKAANLVDWKPDEATA